MKQFVQVAEGCGWKTKVCYVEAGCRGFVVKPLLSLLYELGMKDWSLNQLVTNMVDNVQSIAVD